MGEPGVVAGAAGVVVVVLVTEVIGIFWKDPQPLRRVAASREDARKGKEERVKTGSPECCK
jgi:hypothetical protein